MKKINIILMLLIGFLSCQNPGSAQEISIISVEQASQDLKVKDEIQLLDVRTAEEFSEGHIPNALNISIGDPDFEEQAARLDKSKPVYVYCRSGKRSARAAGVLKKMGFEDIYDIDGGILEWEKKSFETEN